MDLGLSAIEYVLPDSCVSLDELERTGKLETPAARLREFGFECARVSREPAEVLAAAAIERLLTSTGVSPDTIDAIFHTGAIPASHVVAGGDITGLGGFHYPVSKLQYDLGLVNAITTGVSQVGCLGLMTAIRLARDFLIANPSASRVICASADVLPPDGKREFIYNVISDGACAVLVESNAPQDRIVSYREVTKGYYWDATNRKNEIVAAYFPTAQRLVRSTLAELGLEPQAIDWVIPHNVSLRSWEILLQLIDLPRERLLADNIARNGHVIAADNFINLKDASDRGLLRSGQRLLLFNFGFGAHWACLVLER